MTELDLRGKWKHIPVWLVEDDRFLGLSLAARGVLLSLWTVCDRWGRGRGTALAVKRAIGALESTTAEVEQALGECVASKLVVFAGRDADASYQVDDYGRGGPVNALQNPTRSGSM